MTYRTEDKVRILVCGGRHYTDRDRVYRVLKTLTERSTQPVVIVHGDCPPRADGTPGADALADEVAKELGLETEPHPARWDLHGKAAGPIRNREMAESGLALGIVFPGGNGTRNMKENLRLNDIDFVEVNE